MLSLIIWGNCNWHNTTESDLSDLNLSHKLDCIYWYNPEYNPFEIT